ncbi:MAG: hypothetical protein ACREA3_05170 [Nitrosotalea sp.]
MTSEGSVDLTDKMIEEVIKADNQLILFIRGHLYLEHYVNLAIEKKFSNSNELIDDAHFTFNYKIKILHGLGFLDKWLFTYAKAMNEIRNQFAHNLNPADKKIEDKIRSLRIPWIQEKFLSEMNQYARYQIIAVNTVKEIKNALEQNRNALFDYPF